MSTNQTCLNKKGSLEVICGPMFSGKSEELIRRLRRAQIAKQNVLTCKHSLDDRYMIECIISHDGNKLEAEAIEDVNDLMRLGLDNKIEVIGIDEVQWFDTKIVSVISELIESGKRIIVAGYELDFRAIMLKDGLIEADVVGHIPGKNKKHVRIQLHSGKNRIVRRIFKKFDYNVVRLDRINYAGLTKRGLPIGRWRFLKKQEIEMLKKSGEIKTKIKPVRSRA